MDGNNYQLVDEIRFILYFKLLNFFCNSLLIFLNYRSGPCQSLQGLEKDRTSGPFAVRPGLKPAGPYLVRS